MMKPFKNSFSDQKSANYFFIATMSISIIDLLRNGEQKLEENNQLKLKTIQTHTNFKLVYVTCKVYEVLDKQHLD